MDSSSNEAAPRKKPERPVSPVNPPKSKQQEKPTSPIDKPDEPMVEVEVPVEEEQEEQRSYPRRRRSSEYFIEFRARDGWHEALARRLSRWLRLWW